MVTLRDAGRAQPPYRRAMATRTDTDLLDGTGIAARQVRAAGTSTLVLEGGDGPPVVLLHGPAGNATHWLRALPELARTHRVVAPDLPGHGDTETADDALAWLGDLIEQTCAEPPA